MGGGTGFELSKWYADCVSDDGEVIIAYVARMSWRGLHLDYSDILSTGTDGKTRSDGSIFDVSPPSIEEGAFSWKSRALEFEGCWMPAQQPINQTVYSSSAGSVDWECLQPSSNVTISFRNRRISGLGYVERVHITTTPWTLPIDRLNWGRFVAKGQSVIWIDWQGEYSTRHIWVNGKSWQGLIQDQNLLLEPDSRLSLAPKGVLRNGTIGNTALTILPTWIKPLPGRVLGIHETKWISRGEFTAPGREITEGWAIHEVVQWPR